MERHGLPTTANWDGILQAQQLNHPQPGFFILSHSITIATHISLIIILSSYYHHIIIILSPINSEQIWLIGCFFLDAFFGCYIGQNGVPMDHIWACNQELKLHQDLKSSMLGILQVWPIPSVPLWRFPKRGPELGFLKWSIVGVPQTFGKRPYGCLWDWDMLSKWLLS